MNAFAQCVDDAASRVAEHSDGYVVIATDPEDGEVAFLSSGTLDAVGLMAFAKMVVERDFNKEMRA